MNATNNQNSMALDLTHPMAVSCWGKNEKNAPPVLIVNPEASLHQRSALAWVTAYETLTLLEAGQMGFGGDPGGDQAIMNLAVEKVRQLTKMLEDIGDRTAALEGGAA